MASLQYSNKQFIACIFFFNKFIYLFSFGCVGSSLLLTGFLQLWQAGATLRCSAWASHCGVFSFCRAQALGVQASVVVARGLSSCGSRAPERRLSSCGARHVGSSRTRAPTRVPCIGRRILNHCTTREVPIACIFKQML